MPLGTALQSSVPANFNPPSGTAGAGAAGSQVPAEVAERGALMAKAGQRQHNKRHVRGERRTSTARSTGACSDRFATAKALAPAAAARAMQTSAKTAPPPTEAADVATSWRGKQRAAAGAVGPQLTGTTVRADKGHIITRRGGRGGRGGTATPTRAARAITMKPKGQMAHRR